MSDHPIRRVLTMRDLLIQVTDLMYGIDPQPLGALLNAPVMISLPGGQRVTVESVCVEEDDDDDMQEDPPLHLQIHPGSSESRGKERFKTHRRTWLRDPAPPYRHLFAPGGARHCLSEGLKPAVHRCFTARYNTQALQIIVGCSVRARSTRRHCCRPTDGP